MKIANWLPVLALLPLAAAAAGALVIETPDNVPRHPSGMALPEQEATQAPATPFSTRRGRSMQPYTSIRRPAATPQRTR